LLHREVVWVIFSQFRSAACCWCCCCGHVGNALALSIMSTAMPPLALWERSASLCLA